MNFASEQILNSRIHIYLFNNYFFKIKRYQINDIWIISFQSTSSCLSRSFFLSRFLLLVNVVLPKLQPLQKYLLGIGREPEITEVFLTFQSFNDLFLLHPKQFIHFFDLRIQFQIQAFTFYWFLESLKPRHHVDVGVTAIRIVFELDFELVLWRQASSIFPKAKIADCCLVN